MDMFTQTSTCGCSRKHSALSVTSRYQSQYHPRRQSVRSLALLPVALDLHTEDRGDNPLQPLHIRALRPPTVTTAMPATDTEGGQSLQLSDNTEGGQSLQLSDNVLVDIAAANQNGSDCTSETRAAAKCDNDGITSSASAVKPRAGVKTRGHVTESLIGQTVSGKRCDYRSYGHSSEKSNPPLQDDVSEETESRDVKTIVTYGEFVSRRPPPASRPKTDLRQQQRTGRERCRSGMAPADVPADQGKGTSAVRARRGKSAGDAQLGGRACHACSLQRLQQWVKGQRMEETALAEVSTQKLYLPPSGHSRHRRRGSAGGGEVADVTRVSMPGRGLPKLTGLQHELADPSYYDRQRQDWANNQQHRESRQDSRPAPQGSRPMSVVRNRDMLRHVRLGSELLKAREKELEVLPAGNCQDLMETILLYEIPGVSKMKNDYTALVERTGEENANSMSHTAEVTPVSDPIPDLDLTTTTALSSQQSSQFFPSLFQGQRS